MYVSSKGMGRYRRGLGADTSGFQVVTDPTTGEQKVIYPSGQPITTVDVTPSGQNVYRDAGGNVISVSSPSLSSELYSFWADNTKVVVTVAAVAALAFLFAFRRY